MKPVLAWLKANLVTVISVVVALAALPTMLIMSSGWQSDLKSEVQNEVNQDVRAIQGITVQYGIPSLDPSEQAVSFRQVPNEPTNEAIRERLTTMQQHSDRLLEAALERNSRGKTPLVDGLFPEPDPAQEQSKRQEIAERWPEAHRELLREVDAGGPPDPDAILSRLQAERERLISRMVPVGDAELDAEQRAQIQEQLTRMRLEAYRDHALQVRFYATPDVFRNVSEWDVAARGGPPSLERAWDWQHRYWMHEDFIEALRVANTDEVGQMTSAPFGAVKRVESISVDPWPLVELTEEVSPGVPGQAAVSQPVPTNYEVALSGRTAWPEAENPLYDIRYIEASLIVASDQIPVLLNAIAQVNLMTLLDLDVEDVDDAADFALGYDYGSDDVVRARLLVETIWMRPWMAPLMPPKVRAAMNVPDSMAGVESEGDQGETAPQQRGRRSGRGG